MSFIIEATMLENKYEHSILSKNKSDIPSLANNLGCGILQKTGECKF